MDSRISPVMGCVGICWSVEFIGVGRFAMMDRACPVGRRVLIGVNVGR